MTIEILNPIDQLLKHQALLPESDRQSSVMLCFGKPVNMSMTSDFYRIHLTPEMKREGRSETEFYKPEIFQPSRMHQQKFCSACRCEMVKVLIGTWKCQNSRCQRRGHTVQSGPTRGVIAVDVRDDMIANREQIDATELTKSGKVRKLFTPQGVPLKCERVTINACILRLDRRYDPLVLAAVYRTAGAICDQYGWELL